MRRATVSALARTSALVLGLYGCNSLIGLSSLERVPCVGACGGATNGGGAGAGTIATGGVSGAMSGAVSGASGFSVAPGGAFNEGGSSSAGVPNDPPLGEGGAAGAIDTSVCPGGPAPMATWQEHWFEHNQELTRVFFDDCAVTYFDADVPPMAATWLGPYMSKAWAYSLQTYGTMGSEPVYAAFHQGKYLGGHSATFVEASHDYHNVIDAGGSDWTQNYSDITLTLLGFIVQATAAHTKLGSPAFTLWGNSEWQKIYKYDLYLGLGQDDQAAAAFTQFSKSSVSFPRANTFWFRDWFYPLWRDHGHAQVMVNFFSLLEKYYPAVDQQMPDMNWGEYVHFTSGAAHVNLKPLATQAFGWPAEWQTQFEQAQTDYPQITY